MRDVYITNVSKRTRQGPNRSNVVRTFVYGQLREVDTNDLVINAELNYIFNALSDPKRELNLTTKSYFPTK